MNIQNVKLYSKMYPFLLSKSSFQKVKKHSKKNARNNNPGHVKSSKKNRYTQEIWIQSTFYHSVCPLFTIRFVRPTRPIYNHTMTFVIFYSHFLLSTLPLYILFIPITLIHNNFFYNSKVVEVEKAYYWYWYFNLRDFMRRSALTNLRSNHTF